MSEWAVGVTTVPSRRGELLRRTLASLARAGFQDAIRLFVDGCEPADAASYQSEFFMPVTWHWPQIGIYGNWILALNELYIRNWRSDFYAIFQDDIVASVNLRTYLNRTLPRKPKSYWNLYTTSDNHELVRDKQGWNPSNQLGRGALGLVFSRQAVVDLLSQRQFLEKPQTVKAERRTANLDGGIVTALKTMGYIELVHNPSLLQHTGAESTQVKKDPKLTARYRLAPNFRGEDFDCLTLLSN